MFYFLWMLFLIYMLVNDANGKHPVAPGVLYVIHKYVYKKAWYHNVVDGWGFVDARHVWHEAEARCHDRVMMGLRGCHTRGTMSMPLVRHTHHIPHVVRRVWLTSSYSMTSTAQWFPLPVFLYDAMHACSYIYPISQGDINNINITEHLVRWPCSSGNNVMTSRWWNCDAIIVQ